MHKLIFATTAALILTAPLATLVKADETTVIKKNDGLGDRKTIIKKHDEDRAIIRTPEEKKSRSITTSTDHRRLGGSRDRKAGVLTRSS